MPQIWHSFHFHYALTLWMMAHRLLSGSVCIAWYGGIALVWRFRKHYPRMSGLRFKPDQLTDLPMLSILVPACNESSTVARAMASLLQLDYPNFEVIAVNDRSSDDTGEILDSLAAQDSRLKVIHLERLPEGWLGKNHALHVASQAAIGEWMLFTDADVVYRRDAMQVAVAYAKQKNLDHLVVCPHCEGHDFWEKLFMSYFLFMFLLRVRPWDVANPKSRSFYGFGAFNMVKSDSYLTSGGHTVLPMEVADDYKLGKTLKRKGFRSGMLDGSDYLSIRWVFGLEGIWNGFTKNAYASFDFNLIRTFLGALALALTALYPVFGLLVPNPLAQTLSLFTLFAMAGGAFAMRRVTGAGSLYGFAYPLAGLLVIAIIVRSTWVTHRQSGIVWRGTSYKLEELKRGVV